MNSPNAGIVGELTDTYPAGNAARNDGNNEYDISIKSGSTGLLLASAT